MEKKGKILTSGCQIIKKPLLILNVMMISMQSSLEGPANTTWQHMLTDEECTSWTSIARIFQGQYGVHMDPCIAYLRCHKLRNEDLGSVQGLLEAMREYQRMQIAPETTIYT